MFTLRRRAEYALWFAGTLLCGFYTGAYLETHVFQMMGSRQLDEALLHGKRSVTAAPGQRPIFRRSEGSLVGRLEIPRLRLKAIVLEGSEGSTLRRGIGRLPETANPGQEGNLVLSGHRDTFFRPLRNIGSGDRITLVTPQGPYRYVVEWTAVVDPNDTSSIEPTAGPSLTLVTCYPFRYVGPAPQRFIVRARQIA
jgi:sortase A